MIYQFQDKKIGSNFLIFDHFTDWQKKFQEKEQMNFILWNDSPEPTQLQIDLLQISLLPNQLLTLTPFQRLVLFQKDKNLLFFGFNREFYCLLEHDQEVSCNGILFYGTQNLPIITLPSSEIEKFRLLYKVFLDEFENKDTIQGQMLQMLLKRLIIKCTRLAKQQCALKDFSHQQVETIRQFHVLVDIHFRTHKQVQDYAEMLHKSPKTLSNLFALYASRSPLQIIHERIVLEVKRLLQFTDKNIKEIAYEIGYEQSNQLSKLFKKITGQTISEYK